MTIAIASGKGGTGKTTVAVGLAEALSAAILGGEEAVVRLLDCDVEEPNDHLFLGAEETGRSPFSVKVPRIHEEKCSACGDCVDFCEYGALMQLGKKVMVFDNICHGCGGCSLVCPEKAIYEEDRQIGELVWGRTGTSKTKASNVENSGAFETRESETEKLGVSSITERCNAIEALRGVLDVGEALAPPLIRAVKREGGASFDRDIIIDSPPGTTCPMVTAVKDAEFALLVTENTPFGLHDLELAVETISEMNIPMGVVINRSDVGHAEVEEFCRRKEIPVMMRIPYDETVAAGYAKGRSIIDSAPGYGERFRALYRRMQEEIERYGGNDNEGGAE